MNTQCVSLKVKPIPSLRDEQATTVHLQSIVEEQPIAVLGSKRTPEIISKPIKPSPSSCFGPRAATLIQPDGPLWVSDTGHHRLLGWETCPIDDEAPANWVIGQRDMNTEGRNGKQDVSAYSVNVPTGICAYGEGMAVADAWNHRVLIWNTLPNQDNTPADIVLGQVNTTSNLANQREDNVDATKLYWPYGVYSMGERLYVCDSENRRVLIWNQHPVRHGQPADCVLGQNTFQQREENAGDSPNEMSMRWPHSVTIWQNHLCVADAGNNRIMVWKDTLPKNGQACDYILGQVNFSNSDYNRSLYWPRADALNMPYSITSKDQWLITADTANSRLVAWHINDLKTGCSARGLFGQNNFHDKGDNRWLPIGSDTICWPYGVHACGDTLVIADSGNNRVSTWKLNV